ncbi:MAG: glycosyltransferase family 4 protein [Caldilineaceae bacterium]
MVYPKIAHITTIAFSLEHLLLNQLSSIRQAGYEVVGISAPGPEAAVVEAAGIRHLSVPMTRNFTPGADLKAVTQLAQVMRRERFSIVHTHTPKPGLLGQLAARMAGVPIVINTLHGFYFHDGMPSVWRNFYIWTEKVAARCSDIILSQNQEDVQTAIKLGIAPPEKIKPLGNGIDVRRFDRARIAPASLDRLREELHLRADRPVIGFVGRLVAEKGILELLEAARIVLKQAPDAQFLVIGPIDYDKPDALTPAIAEEYGVAHAFTFTGLRHDMPELYALMDLFVLPSHREGFPRSPMEASALGVPSIVTDIRGCREAVAHGKNGLLAPLYDVQALAAAMIELIKAPTKARQMGAVGRQMALARFDETLVFERVKAEYARLLTEKGELLGRSDASLPARQGYPRSKAV